VTSTGTIGQCTMEENTAFVGATLNDGTMRIKYVESGVYLYFCASHRSMAYLLHSLHMLFTW
jgi:plastocyanin